jgi:mannosyltransferase OCH1-like enzyme
MYKFLLIFLILSLNAYEIPSISFDDGFSVEINPKKANSRNYSVFQKIYDNYLENASVEEEYKIPKLIHLIWVGSPFPKKYQKFLESWRSFHPDWTIRLWTDAEVEDFHMENKQAFDEASNKGQKSDIWRYEILYRYGGLYVDTDFQCLQSFDDLHKSCEFYAGCIGLDQPWVINALIGAKPNHPLMRACIDRLELFSKNPYDFEKIMDETGPYYLTRILLDLGLEMPLGSVVVFPPVFFYPFPGAYRDRLDKNIMNFVKPESMAVHYWNCSWQK